MDERTQHVYLIDDDDAVRVALGLLLETVGLQVAMFGKATDFLARCATLPAGCVVVDIRMPMLSGLQLQERLASAGCTWPVVVISGHGDIDACRRAFKNGAIDFLSKPVDENDLIDAIQKGLALLRDHASRDAERAESAALLTSLSAREHEVLDLVCRGLITREIAALLQVSPRTVDSHRASVAAKLGTASPIELARIVALAHPGR